VILPRLGAVGLFCAGGIYWTDGDLGYFNRGAAPATSRDNVYLKDADPSNPRAFPALSPAVMAKFTPTLLISGTCDFALSLAVYAHSVLAAQGVQTDLYVREGLGHSLFIDRDVPQPLELYAIISRFFQTRPRGADANTRCGHT